MNFSFFSKQFWFLILAICSIYSCNSSCKKIYLSKSDKSWLDFASINDTIAFSNLKNDEDTFVVIYKYLDWGICNRFELGDGQKQIGEIGVQKIENGKLKVYNAMFKISFNGDNSYDTISKSSKHISVFDIETDYFLDFNDLKETAIFMPTLKKIIQVLFVKAGNKTKESTDIFPKVDEFYWNEKLGLIAYKKKFGEMYYYSRKW